MKKALLVSLLSTVALPSARAQAELLCTLGPATPYDSMLDMPASTGAQADVKKLKALLCPKGCGKLFLFANTTTPNTAAVSDGHGASKISYSPSFVKSVQQTFGPAATLGIFAHVIGHHLEASGNRPAWMKETWEAELRADAWAGCAMAKADLKPSGLQAVLLALSEHPSPRHPAWSARRPVITEGFKACGGRLLPPLAKENPEPNATATTTASKVDGAGASPGGCTGDKDCRKGRVCVNSRCAAAPERRRCGKDTDCPDPQECSTAGVCETPATATQAAADDEDPPAKPPGAMVAAAMKADPAPQPPAADSAASCTKTCYEIRDLCVDAATSEGNKCVATIQADPNYKACACRSFPSVSNECYAFCAGASDRSKGCSTTGLVKDCRTDGERCRARCK
jgi:hypothetical protein